MKPYHLLSTTAAILMLAGAASAQTTKTDEAPARAPAAQQNAPAEKIAPNMKAGQRGHETTGQATKSNEPGMNEDTNRHSDMDKGQAGEKHGEMNKNQTMDKHDSHGASNAANENASEKTGTAEQKSGTGMKSSQSANEHGRATTGQGAAAGTAKLSSEQRTKIKTVIRERKTRPVHLNVSVSVGTRIPTSVHLYPLPSEVITIYPEWRGFEYVLVGDEIVVIDPHSHEIVAILEA